MRQATIYYKSELAGTLTETDEGIYTFQYDASYIEKHPGWMIAFSMPVAKGLYTNTRLFPFFEGLIPEGWLLDIASRNWKINPNDRMGLLMACCSDCIGAVSVLPLDPEDE